MRTCKMKVNQKRNTKNMKLLLLVWILTQFAHCRLQLTIDYGLSKQKFQGQLYKRLMQN